MSEDPGDCYEPKHAIFPLIAGTISLVFTIATTLSFFVNYNYAKQQLSSFSQKNESKIKKKDNIVIKRWAAAVLIFYSIFSIAQFASLIIDLANDCLRSGLGVSGVLVYFLATLGVLNLFGIRIIKTFENTTYAVSSLFIKFRKIITPFIVVVVLITLILRAIKVITISASLIVGLFGTSILFMYGLLLLRLFVNTLNRIIGDFVKEFSKIPAVQLANLNKSVSVSFQDNPEADFGGLSANDAQVATSGADKTIPSNSNVKNMRYLTRLIADMSKYTITVGVAVVSTLISMILALVLASIVNGPQLLQAKHAMAAMAVDSAVNCICLVLQFEFSKKWYKNICNKCHVKCEDRYTNKTNKKLKESTNTNKQLERLPSREIGFKVDKNTEADSAKAPDFAAVEQVATAISVVGQKSVDTLHT